MTSIYKSNGMTMIVKFLVEMILIFNYKKITLIKTLFFIILNKDRLKVI